MAREKVKHELNEKFAINIGNPGDMVTGQAFQLFFSDAARSYLTSLVPEDQKESFRFILLGLCTTVKIINSHKRQVNIEKLRYRNYEYEHLIGSGCTDLRAQEI